MPSFTGPSVFSVIFESRRAAHGLWLGAILTVCGCVDSPPAPPTPPAPAPSPVVIAEQNKETDVKIVPDNPSVVNMSVPKPGDPVVSEAETSFEGLSANEKLDRIAAVIRSSWGDGSGFQYAPEASVKPTSEDPLVLTLRWQSVEKKVAPLLKRAFGIEKTLVCRFTSPGEFECNHPVYQLAIQRAQNRPEEFAVIHARVDATLPGTAPVLREQFLLQVGRKTEFYEAIGSSLKGMALPGQLEFSGDHNDSSADNQQCVLLTKWAALPAAFEKSTDADKFQWRLKLVIREAVDSLESEWDNLSTEKNRLELVSFAQYRRGQDEPFEVAGPLGITAMGFAPDTTILRSNKKFMSRLASASEVLGSLEQYPSAGAYPNPATFVGHSDPMRKLITSVHQKIQQHLTESAPE